jgi:hypothetical protein
VDSAVQRTFDLEIPCCCLQPAFCERYHGLPGSWTQQPDPEREALFARHAELWPLSGREASDERHEVWRQLVAL